VKDVSARGARAVHVATFAVERPNRGNARETTYRMLREAIIDGRYRLGQHLVEQVIAEQLNVSKTPVREALARLEQEGIVESFPHRGFFIRDFTERDMREIYELREIYEKACARTAAEGPRHREIARELHEANESARHAFETEDVDGVHQHFAELDEVVFAASDNRLLREEIEHISARVHLCGVLTNQIPGRIETSLAQHEAIIEAIASGEGPQSEERMREHIRSLMEDELERRRAGPVGVWRRPAP
jgi:DNA-binding GntR family transcriptional regulator